MTTETAIPSFLGAAVQRREDPALITALSGNVPDGVTPGLDEEIHLKSGGLNFPSGCHLAVVDIDPESGSPRLDRMWAVDDAGNIVNPCWPTASVIADSDKESARPCGRRSYTTRTATWSRPRFMDYLIPTAVSLSLFGLAGTVTPTPTNPLGAKGLGEAGAIGSTPAVVNAVADALGGADVQLPVTSEQIWRILHS